MCPKLTTSFHQHLSSVLISHLSDYTTFLWSKPEVCKSDSTLLFCHQGVIPKGKGINYNRFILFLNTVDSDKYNHLLFFPTCLQTWVGRNHGCAKDGFWYISPTVIITDALLSPVKFFFASMLSLSQHMGGILALGRCPVKVFQSPHHHCARPCAMEYMY